MTMTTLTAEDIALLHRFEPVLCFNKGEQFFPMDVERFIAAAQLCVQRPNDMPEVVVPRGRLTPELLAQHRHDLPGAVYFLHFVDPLRPKEVQHFRRSSALKEFHAGQGRLARVGLLSRLGDLVFSVSLLLRGRVPGGTAAAAALRYQAIQAEDRRYCYYGRVAREHGYIALQYWFFYAFNDWRSSFNGVNDHEADWEMITVYAVQEADGNVRPAWLAYSSHEFEGDDLRRRWDDPDLHFVGEHPLVFVAAGAHANYFFPGEYVLAAEVPYTRSLVRIWGWVQSFWQDALRQASRPRTPGKAGLIRIPFVDYARGDGLRIGPGEASGWEMRLLQATLDAPAPLWVDGYRGLWGLYTGDLLEGENAPARPKYNRDGTVLRLWYDPVGWCGLDKVPPPGGALVAIEAQLRRLENEQDDLVRQIDEQAARAAGLEMELGAIQQLPDMRGRAIETRRQARAVALEVDRLKARRAANTQVIEELDAYAARMAASDYGPPRLHLSYPQLPASTDDVHLGRLAETWSAVSIGVLLVGTVVLALLSLDWEVGLLAMLGVYLFIEALFRRQVQWLVRTGIVGLAIFTALLLLFEFFWPVIGLLALFAGLLVIVENVRELRA